MSQTATDLLAAADYIEEHGLWQGGGYWADDGRAACAVGAIISSLPGGNMDERNNRVAEARVRLCEYLGIGRLFAWSDNAASKEVVINAMRRAAAE